MYEATYEPSLKEISFIHTISWLLGIKYMCEQYANIWNILAFLNLPGETHCFKQLSSIFPFSFRDIIYNRSI